jgi:uncharacterized protein
MKKDHLPIAALAGFVIAMALAFGQLTRPEVVIGWVDFFGAWNPRMLVFLVAATVVYQAFTRVQARRQGRAGGPAVCAPVNRRIDARLLIGASIFGIGWAIAGVCPGPALASLGTGAPWAAVFVVAMGVGLALASLDELLRHRQPERPSSICND